MSLPGQLDGLKAVRRAVVADLHGEVRDATPDEAWRPDQDAAAAAVALAELGSAGAALGLAGLELLLVKGPSRATATALRPDALLLVEVDAAQKPGDVERALSSWAAGEVGAHASPPPLPAPAAASAPVARIATVQAAAAPAAAPSPTAWSLLRRALSRGHLTEAAALLRDVVAAPSAAARPEAVIADPEAFQEAARRVLEGVGSVLAGDTSGGARALRDVAAPAQPNLSLRWLAAFWCARAALAGGSIDAARRHVKDTLDLSRQLDVEARASSQLVAAELLLRAGELDKALAWLSESRSRFQRGGDAWGAARTWLVEARVRAAAGASEACEAAARSAGEAEPGWDGPPIFLAGRALAAGDLDGAGALLAPLASTAAARVRKLVAAIREGAVSLADGTEFLRLHLAPPTTSAMRELERIADAAPRFLQAREAQAWMLVKLGRYIAARSLFVWLDRQPLDGDDRALVSLGLRCVDAALQGEPPAPGADGVQAAPDAPPPSVGGSVPPGAPGAGAALGGPADASAVFSGRLSVFALPDLVEFLRTARRSGLLACSSAAGVGTLSFHQGYLVAGAAPGAPPAEDASPAALRGAIEAALRELVRWSDGEFVFNKDPDDAPGAEAPAVLVDAQELLLELFRQQDEAARTR